MMMMMARDMCCKLHGENTLCVSQWARRGVGEVVDNDYDDADNYDYADADADADADDDADADAEEQ